MGEQPETTTMPRTGPKVLILYAQYGEGHWQAAQALKAGFARQGIADVRLFDLLAESHPIVNGVSRFVYRNSYTYWPHFYGWVYRATKDMKPRSLLAHWLHSFGADTMKRLIRREQPDIVIHTFPTLVVPAIAGRLGRRIRIYNVVTDFELHMRWVHPHVNKYYVATEDLREQLAGTGVPRERIAATGIPLRGAFVPNREKTAFAAAKFGLDPDRPVVLVMAGAYGALPGIRGLCDRLCADPGVQTAIVCGRNRVLASHLSHAYVDNANVAVFGYVEQIDELMGLSACIVTKPGGLTLSEAILAGLPIFLYRPVPGQEQGNARYLAAKGAAVVCRTNRELADAVHALLRDGARRREMLAALEGLRKEGAADRIVLDILQELPIIEINESATHS
ncbi:glycosyltransferase [Cohnella sp. REN36]|uniref:MGDG synthase family glycosyltransferase n=1 Tax=Cohnella sp. REN36 TaxID=2887347 RepID=UPI001D14985F|nr:glycosyltransferase [Cohnella sp. REN36]MCC3374767.1 glycosyltransferase [Cohnella sp. REN36]